MDRDGVEQLVISLNDWRVDKAAVKTALIEAGERAVEPLLALLWRVQGGRLDLWDYAIADIVAKVGDVRFLAPLVELLNAEPALSRGAAATALGGIGGTRAYEALAACVLREKDEGVRSKIFDALAAGKDAAIKPLADILAAGHIAEDVRRSAADALVRIGGPNVVEPLSGCLPHHQPRFDIRRCCSEVFAKTRDRRATLPLIAYLSRKPHHELQSYAVGALGEIGDARAVDALIECLKDENARVRKDAAEALGKIQDGRGTMPLVTCLNDESSEVHPEAAKALGRIGDARAVDFLVQYLGNRGPHAHWWAVEALGKIGDARAIEPLADHLCRYSDHSAVAAKALAAIGQQHRASVVRRLLRVSRESRISVRFWATVALCELGEPLARPWLVETMVDLIEATAAPEGLKRHEAEALDLVATKADIELSDDIKRLATEALGYREKTVSTRTVVSYEEASSAIEMLCNRGELLSSCVLHRVAKKKDGVVTLRDPDYGESFYPSSGTHQLNFNQQRRRARRELRRRGFAGRDPLTGRKDTPIWKRLLGLARFD